MGMTAILEVPLEDHAMWVNTFTHPSEGTDNGFLTLYPEMDLIVSCYLYFRESE
jgi:hypothetical protein